MRHSSGPSFGIVVEALTNSSGGDPGLLILQRHFRSLRGQLLEREEKERFELATLQAGGRDRMLHHFNIEKRIFAETDLTMCVYHERAERKEISLQQRNAFVQLSSTVWGAAIPQLIVLTQAQHARRACFIWLAQSLSRAELYHRMSSVVKVELSERRHVTELLHRSLGAGGAMRGGRNALATTSTSSEGDGRDTVVDAAVEQEASRLLRAQRAHDAVAQRIHSLRQEKAEGVFAAMVHALLSAQHAARTRLLWEEEMVFRQILRLGC